MQGVQAQTEALLPGNTEVIGNLVPKPERSISLF